MEENNVTLPLLPAKEETICPPTPIETTTMKVEVTASDTDQDFVVNDSEDVGGEGEATEDGDNGESGDVVPEVIVRKKKGRPRKHPVVSPHFSGGNIRKKRERGRPSGIRKVQMSASSLGELANPAGGGLTGCQIRVKTGEDIAGVLSSFARTCGRSFFILSVVGCVSIVDIRPPSGSGILRFEGCFALTSLSGSYDFSETGCKIGTLTAVLGNSDGRGFGGIVAGSLIAATPTKLLLGSYQQNNFGRHSSLTSAATGSPGVSDGVRVPVAIVKSKKVEENCVVTPIVKSVKVEDDGVVTPIVKPVKVEEDSVLTAPIVKSVKVEEDCVLTPVPFFQSVKVEENCLLTPIVKSMKVEEGCLVTPPCAIPVPPNGDENMTTM